jgi:hypothetical protein
VKRVSLMDRLALLTDRQESLVRAARDFARAEKETTLSPHAHDQARRELFHAGVQLGLACKRYLGGRE